MWRILWLITEETSRIFRLVDPGRMRMNVVIVCLLVDINHECWSLLIYIKIGRLSLFFQELLAKSCWLTTKCPRRRLLVDIVGWTWTLLEDGWTLVDEDRRHSLCYELLLLLLLYRDLGLGFVGLYFKEYANIQQCMFSLSDPPPQWFYFTVWFNLLYITYSIIAVLYWLLVYFIISSTRKN